ncbi:patatin-like phospholipase family protein [Subtercola frigoramans]|uniref:NTE family protein n=1 Tax=Subtercola frigoramans TaxID=120298 RepID=A0ABS2L7M5_9MICO|nr:patatin-like phospholipase family protein [Subtercola frigoramans]MBM7473110.1 NTE family protein [Subtercola frigoramans]
MTNGALVLAGGGLSGIAWETGLLLGIQDVEPEAAARIIGAPTTLIGTSAGSNVAAHLAAGTSLQYLFDRQLEEKNAEVFVEVDFVSFMASMADARSEASSADDARRRIGAIAVNTETIDRDIRRDVIEARLSGLAWADRDLRITAVDADTGVPVVFDRTSGVSLIDAVEASSAVPGVWPVVPLAGHRYIDGGVRAMANADLAAGFDPVLVLIPQAERTPAGFSISPAELDALTPSRAHVVYADVASLAAFGANPLDPGVRRPSALAGRDLGQSIAAEIASFWLG